MRSSSTNNAEESSSSTSVDPWDVMSGLTLLVVEGRTPGGEKGFHAGPHCPALVNSRPSPHLCSPHDNPVCGRAMSLLRQLRIMWSAGVGVCVEVLVAPECEHGAAITATIDTTGAPPRHKLRLIEHWNFAINHCRAPSSVGIGGLSLMAAVRSFLHFSQLSAWLSLSDGRRPPHVLYRLSVSSPVFCSKFEGDTEEHVFPLACFGTHTSIQVSVKSLPRTTEIPIAVCLDKHGELLLPSSSDSMAASSSVNVTNKTSTSQSTDKHESSFKPNQSPLIIDQQQMDFESQLHLNNNNAINVRNEEQGRNIVSTSSLCAASQPTMTPPLNLKPSSDCNHPLSSESYSQSPPRQSFKDSSSLECCTESIRVISMTSASGVDGKEKNGNYSDMEQQNSASQVGHHSPSISGYESLNTTYAHEESSNYKGSSYMDTSCTSDCFNTSISSAYESDYMHPYDDSVSNNSEHFSAHFMAHKSSQQLFSSPQRSQHHEVVEQPTSLQQSSIFPTFITTSTTASTDGISISKSVAYVSSPPLPTLPLINSSQDSSVSWQPSESFTSASVNIVSQITTEPQSSNFCQSSASTSQLVPISTSSQSSTSTAPQLIQISTSNQSSAPTSQLLPISTASQSSDSFASQPLILSESCQSSANKSFQDLSHVQSSINQASSKMAVITSSESSFLAESSSQSPSDLPSQTLSCTNGSDSIASHGNNSLVTSAKNGKNDDLRVTLMRAHLLDESSNNSSSRGSSPDIIQLGESLLDPPHSSRILRAYNSPSRSGSPSRETPEHIMYRPRHYSVSDIRISSPTSKMNDAAQLMGIDGSVVHQSLSTNPDVVICGRPGTHSSLYNPLAWTQSKYPGAVPCAPTHSHASTHHRHHTCYDSSELCEGSSSATVVNGSTIQNNSIETGELNSNSTSSSTPDNCHNGTYSSTTTSVNIFNNSRNTNYTEDFANGSGTSNGTPKIINAKDCLKSSRMLHERQLVEEKCAALKLDLSCVSRVAELCDDATVPPDEWSPRSRALLLQHIGGGGGGTKRKVDTWEESASKGQRKDHSFTNYKKDVKSNGSSGDKRQFDLSSKETVEILKVLHRRPLAVRKTNLNARHQSLLKPFSHKLSQPIDIKSKTPPRPESPSQNSTPSSSSVYIKQMFETCSSNGNSFEGKWQPGQYRNTSVPSDTEEEEEEEEEEGEDEKNDRQEDVFTVTSPDDDGDCCSETLPYAASVDAKTVRSRPQLYCATSESVSSCVKSTHTASAPCVNHTSSSNSQAVSPGFAQSLELRKNINESLNRQVACIGERVRRTLSFDSEEQRPSATIANKLSNNIAVSNGKEPAVSNPSTSSGTQRNLLKSLMKRSYQVCSDSVWSNCKQAKPDIPSSEDTANECEATPIVPATDTNGSIAADPTVRPDSPGTLLGDQEVALINTSSSSLSTAINIPSSNESQRNKEGIRPTFNSTSNLVFHCKTGLPLTSSPVPLRKGGSRFDFDSSLSSVAAIRRSTSFHSSAHSTGDSELSLIDCECHSDSEAGGVCTCKPSPYSASAPATVTSSNLLGTFEECVLHGRLEPVSTVQGFKTIIAASGSFCPEHITKPVTVLFYTLCDNDHFSSPYMGLVRLERKGYKVPNKGTVQVTLLNPMGTVVKMFVVMYDLSDMPPNSRTFLRQRTLNMPVGASDQDANAHQWLRYLIHLKFASSKTGKVYLHTDIRMLIFRKSDADAAAVHKTATPYELRSFTHGPMNPRYSPRK